MSGRSSGSGRSAWEVTAFALVAASLLLPAIAVTVVLVAPESDPEPQEAWGEAFAVMGTVLAMLVLWLIAGCCLSIGIAVDQHARRRRHP